VDERSEMRKGESEMKERRGGSARGGACPRRGERGAWTEGTATRGRRASYDSGRGLLKRGEEETSRKKHKTTDGKRFDLAVLLQRASSLWQGGYAAGECYRRS
jgi:hypothetical protein